MVLYLGSDRVGTTIEKEYLGIPLELSAQGVLQKPTKPFTWKSQGTSIKDYGLYYAFYNCTGLTSVDLSSVTTLSGIYGSAFEYAFARCKSLTTVNLSGLNALNVQYSLRSAFLGCTSLTTVDLSGLTSITGGQELQEAFKGCTSLATMSFPSLTTLRASYTFLNAFQSCTSLTSVSFPALTSTSFGSYTNQFNNMLVGVTGCTVHFPSNLQSVIGSWSDVTSGFSGTNTTVLFDLPATE
jgi:hypothetical protein